MGDAVQIEPVRSNNLVQGSFSKTVLKRNPSAKEQTIKTTETLICLIPEVYVPQSGDSCGEFLGQGAQGVVLAATDQTTNEKVVLKQIKTKVVRIPRESDEAYNKRKQYHFQCILREWGLLASVSHPHIVNYKGWFFDNSLLPNNEHSGLFYLIMERMDFSLFDIIAYDQKPQTTRKNMQTRLTHVGFFLFQILRAVEYLDNNNIMHRDIKPGNIGVNTTPLEQNGPDTRALTFKLFDLGYSRICNKDPSAHTKGVGSPLYQAPELLFARPYDSKVDVWSVFATACELLTGEAIFQPSPEDLIKCEGLPVSKQCTFVKKKVLAVCGTTKENKPYDDVGYEILLPFPKTVRLPIRDWLSGPIQQAHGNCNEANFLSLLESVFVFDPSTRPSAQECLRHNFFLGLEDVFHRIYQENLAVEPDFEAQFNRQVSFPSSTNNQ